MILRQFLHSGPVAASYLFGCGGKASAAVVDPVGDIAPYIEAAKALGVRILYVIDTHLHADHVSSGRALAAASGAEYVLHADAAAKFPFKGVVDGEVLELGNVVAKVLHTPGHTPEHISLLVTDRTRAAEPWFVLTGHTLMVGDLGRTELASSAEDGARALFKSIQVLKALPESSSSIGFELRHNTAFGIKDEEEFVRVMTADIPPPPPEAAQNRAINTGLEVPA
ncbi:MAG: MBL fold metallo-hydrolase [Rhodobacterales bacterium 32-67-9]|nr:MAG: MBL fold metallo-hydrolase [Rhodobacterales bacterium 32-67-9]